MMKTYFITFDEQRFVPPVDMSVQEQLDIEQQHLEQADFQPQSFCIFSKVKDGT